MIDWLRSRSTAELTTSERAKFWEKIQKTPLILHVDGHPLPIKITKRAQSTQMTLRLSPAGDEIRISLPSWGRKHEAVKFAIQKKPWLEAQLHKLPQKHVMTSGSEIAFCGMLLKVEWDRAYPRNPQKEGHTIRLGGPEEGMHPRLRRWLMAEAHKIIAEDLADYCAKAAQPIPRLALSSPERRWGSCSSKRSSTEQTIRINWRLIMAPPCVRRSVVAHEVAHLLHFDHSPAFYTALNNLYEGDIIVADDWLKNHGRTVYAPFG